MYSFILILIGNPKNGRVKKPGFSKVWRKTKGCPFPKFPKFLVREKPGSKKYGSSSNSILAFKSKK
jgi:hypothetical protein